MNSGLDPVISQSVTTSDILFRSTTAHLNHVYLLTNYPLKNVNAILIDIVTTIRTVFISDGRDSQKNVNVKCKQTPPKLHIYISSAQ